MPEPIPGSVMLTTDNVDHIVEVAAKRGFTLRNLRDEIEDNAEDGFDTIMFTSVYPWNKQISNFNVVPFDESVHPSPRVPLMSTDEFIALLETTPEIV